MEANVVGDALQEAEGVTRGPVGRKERLVVFTMETGGFSCGTFGEPLKNPLILSRWAAVLASFAVVLSVESCDSVGDRGKIVRGN